MADVHEWERMAGGFGLGFGNQKEKDFAEKFWGEFVEWSERVYVALASQEEVRSYSAQHLKKVLLIVNTATRCIMGARSAIEGGMTC